MFRSAFGDRRNLGVGRHSVTLRAGAEGGAVGPPAGPTGQARGAQPVGHGVERHGTPGTSGW